MRHVDDFAVFHGIPAALSDWRDQIERYLKGWHGLNEAK